MAQKKKKPVRPASVNQQKKVVEQAAVAPHMAPKAKAILVVGAVIMAVAIGAMLYSNSYEYGSDFYMLLQKVTYGLTGVSGALIAYSTKFNESKNKLNIQVMGLVLMMLGFGNFISLFMRP